MEEIWAIIDEFQNYSISNYGRVVNNSTGRVLKESVNTTGVAKIGLVVSGVQYTRSVAGLVATAFVEGWTQVYDTPIHLDGDPRNNTAWNLMWRPRWFALKHSRQFKGRLYHGDMGPIINVNTQALYHNIEELVRTEGLLAHDVFKGVYNQLPVFPTNCRYAVAR